MESADFFIYHLSCPISKEKIGIPIITEDGFTYDKISMENWLCSSDKSPMMGTPLTSKKKFINRSIHYLLAQYDFLIMQSVHSKYMRKKSEIYVKELLPLPLKHNFESIMIEYFQLVYPLTDFYKKLETLITQYPNNVDILIEYANMKRFGGELESSLKIIRDAIKISPNYSVPRYLEARVMSIKGNIIEGKEIIDANLKRHAIIDHLLFEVRYLSSAYLSVSSKNDSFRLIEAYVKICHDDMRAFLNYIYTLYLIEDIEKVLIESKKFLKRYKYDACIMYYKAKALCKKSKIVKAHKCLDTIIGFSKEPSFLAQCYYNKAAMRSGENEFELFKEELEKANSLYPKINADFALADKYKARKNYFEAMRWLQMYGNHVDKLNDIYYNRLNAELSEKLGNTEEALNSYILLIEKDGINTEYYTSRINSLL